MKALIYFVMARLESRVFNRHRKGADANEEKALIVFTDPFLNYSRGCVMASFHLIKNGGHTYHLR